MTKPIYIIVVAIHTPAVPRLSPEQLMIALQESAGREGKTSFDFPTQQCDASLAPPPLPQEEQSPFSWLGWVVVFALIKHRRGLCRKMFDNSEYNSMFRLDSGRTPFRPPCVDRGPLTLTGRCLQDRTKDGGQSSINDQIQYDYR